jgi:glycerate kinase
MAEKNAQLNLLVAPNGFKGSLQAIDACSIIAKALSSVLPDANIIQQPIADGGEQTTQIITNACGGELKKVTVKDPLNRPIEATYGLIDGGKTGVIEMCAASGMQLLTTDELNPMRASTFGTGQLLVKLLEEGCTKIIIGLGGSATVDAGTGMLKALGIRLTEKNKSGIPLGGGYLHTIENIDLTEADPRLKDCEINVLCDVENTLNGLEGAAMMFAPQKGATPEQVRILSDNIEHFTRVTQRLFGIDMSELEFGGSAGGTAAALAAYTEAELVNGIEYLMDIVDMEEKVKQADAVITAEGQLDEQTLKGKGPYGLAKLAKKHGKPVICITGALAEGMTPEDFPLIDVILPLATRPMSLEESIRQTATLLDFTCKQIAHLIGIGASSCKY